MEALLFRRLEGAQKRSKLDLKPGPLLVAVYGDNWSGTFLPCTQCSFAQRIICLDPCGLVSLIKIVKDTMHSFPIV